MISYSGEIMKMPDFVKVKGEKDPFHYQEGPWAWKRNGHYYMAYASTCCPEGIGYAMSNSPTGPWEYQRNDNGRRPALKRKPSGNNRLQRKLLRIWYQLCHSETNHGKAL